RAGVRADAVRARRGRTREQTRGEGGELIRLFACRLRLFVQRSAGRRLFHGCEHSPFESLQAQMVFEFARVFEQIDLRVAVCAECDADACGEVEIGGGDTVAQVALGRRAGADASMRAREFVDLCGCDVDGVDGRCARVEQTLISKGRDGRAP